MSMGEELLREQQVEDEVKRSTRFLRAENERLTEEAKELRKLAAFYDSVRTAPIKPPRWTVRPSTGKRHVGLAVAQIADWHLDEVVNPEEVLGLNKFDRKIAHQRIGVWLNKVITQPREYMKGVEFEGLVLPATGDLFTGDIHAELKESNEDKLLASVLYWMEPIIGVLETLEREWKDVYLPTVVGNHGRLSTRPIFKGRVKDNVEWLFWSVVRDRLADRGTRVRVDVSPSMDFNVPLYGRNHLLTHGDQFKGGSGISGAFAPLNLGSHRKDKRQRIAEMPMHTMVIGHKHQLINIPGVIMGGCLKGYDEYAFGENLVPDAEGASQAFWVTTPEHGQTTWQPIFLQDRKAEGW